MKKESSRRTGATLRALYDSHHGKVSDKWESYLNNYEKILEPFRNKRVRLLKIGVQNGGSLEIWAKYFPFAEQIVGCDINPLCKELLFDDPRISIIVGDANSPETFKRILNKSSIFDIIIDDGSHMSGDIVKTFSLYFPFVSSNGVFLAEDLHCSYWQEFDGGAEAPYSSINFFKRLSDYVNLEHWGADVAPDRLVSFFGRYWKVEFDPKAFRRISEVRFLNSLAAVFAGEVGSNVLGRRIVVGEVAEVSKDPLGVAGSTSSTPNQSANSFGPLTARLEEAVLSRDQFKVMAAQLSHTQEKLSDAEEEIKNLIVYIEKFHFTAHENKILLNEVNRLKKIILKIKSRPFKQFRKNLKVNFLKSCAGFVGLFSDNIRDRIILRINKYEHKNSPILRNLYSPSYEHSLYEKMIFHQELIQNKNDTKLSDLAKNLEGKRLISIIMPVYNPDPRLLEAAIQSVINQRYTNWELCIADDSSDRVGVREKLEEFAKADSRIKIFFRDSNGHISAASNTALGIASGQFFAFLDHDDILDKDTLLYIAEHLEKNPDVKILYTDEDKIDTKGKRGDPHFKSDWNRDLLYGCNYISHFGVYEANLVKDVGGFRIGYEGAQDYDLLLRCVSKCRDEQIAHIPKVLYHWRTSPGSTADSSAEKPYATRAGVAALTEHLQSIHGNKMQVEPGPYPTTYIVRWPLPEKLPLVSLIIPTRDRLDLIKAAVDSILDKTSYTNFEIVIVDNGSQEDETLKWFQAIQLKDRRVSVIRDDRPFNYSALNNFAVTKAEGEIIGLINNDIEVITPNWLSEMVSLAVRPWTGCVGAKLYYLDGSIQHGGVITGIGGVAGHSHKNFPRSHPGYFTRLQLRQELSAVTGACLLVRKSIFVQVGGLNEKDLAIAFNDVDFCLKVREAGYRNVWTPLAELYHHESPSRGSEDDPAKVARFNAEAAYMKDRWGTLLERDPFYNPHLTLDAEDFSLKRMK